jgi:predicted nucleic acid-binding protein
MMLMDVNVLVYAHREDVRDHLAYREWLESVINSGTAYGYSELVLSGFNRVVTHPKVFERPSPLEAAVAFNITYTVPLTTVTIRVGSYRVRYEVQEQCLVILVVAVGHRREVYR